VKDRPVKYNFLRSLLAVMLLWSSVTTVSVGQVRSDSAAPGRAAVVLSGDTLFFISSTLGPFSPRQRADAVTQRIEEIVKRNLDPRSMRVEDAQGYSNIVLGDMTIMAVTNEDAVLAGTVRSSLSMEYVGKLQQAIGRTEHEHSMKMILTGVGLTVLMLLAAVLLFLAMRWFFPKSYAKLESWEGSVFRPLRIGGHEVVSPGALSAIFIILFKGLRLAATLSILYFFITYSLSFFPWTRYWDVKPFLVGVFLTILTTTAVIVAVRAANSFFRAMMKRVHDSRGSLIKPVKLKNLEVLSEERIVEAIGGSIRITRLFTIVALGYLYITVVFSFFDFTKTWAGTLISYIVDPLWNVLLSFIQYLPSLFFILVIIGVTRFAIKFIKLIFDEVARGSISLPGFYRDWAEPTYKIIRFLVFAFAGIVIFPYLPGSSSPVFQGISVFLGILFSLGSTSAISNIVAGVVLTYMRPFKIGDRVKIADTVGDVVEKTLLVTRVRTIKNVDITIPNSMVLGSHIINFSSSAQERGLVLHTGVTIGYDAPWKKVHELLIAAAQNTEGILKEPKPFVFQASLDDFFVSYEINAYTNRPNDMAKIYSDLHQSIQDRFNEAGVEITSPHYAAVRDGNRTAIPDQYLPPTYRPSGFRVFSSGSKPESEEK
jgi:small-conductance mechanosensitive channel